MSRATRRNKDIQRYNSNPPKPPPLPRCHNCSFFIPSVFAQPAFNMQFKPHWCNKGEFIVLPKATCDDWESK